jgi:hypothetical protein
MLRRLFHYLKCFTNIDLLQSSDREESFPSTDTIGTFKNPCTVLYKLTGLTGLESKYRYVISTLRRPQNEIIFVHRNFCTETSEIHSESRKIAGVLEMNITFLCGP